MFMNLRVENGKESVCEWGLMLGVAGGFGGKGEGGNAGKEGESGS